MHKRKRDSEPRIMSSQVAKDLRTPDMIKNNQISKESDKMYLTKQILIKSIKILVCWIDVIKLY